MYQVTFGEALRAKRLSLNLTQVALAAEVRRTYPACSYLAKSHIRVLEQDEVPQGMGKAVCDLLKSFLIRYLDLQKVNPKQVLDELYVQEKEKLKAQREYVKAIGQVLIQRAKN